MDFYNKKFLSVKGAVLAQFPNLVGGVTQYVQDSNFKCRDCFFRVVVS